MNFFIYVLYKTYQHLQLTFCALLIASLIAIPLGIILAKSQKKILSFVLLRFVAFLQTIPSLALIALIVVILVVIHPFLPLPTTGFLPGVIVLSTYALLPILNNTYTGIKQVSPRVLEVARGMGMTYRQMLWMVELPLALPILFMGIRISLVWTIACATLTSLIGSGGLGDLIMQGLRSMQIGLILAGTLPAAFLAIILDTILSFLGNSFGKRK